MNRKHLRTLALVCSALLPVTAFKAQGQSTPTAQTQDKKQTIAPQKTTPVHSDGERIFAQNCARCHNAPEGFRPSISGTIVRHMRVRAQLSQHDEEELLHFFNP